MPYALNPHTTISSKKQIFSTIPFILKIITYICTAIHPWVNLKERGYFMLEIKKHKRKEVRRV
jgi:hypothetical protein